MLIGGRGPFLGSADAALRALVLSGAGRGFSSGFDLKEQMTRNPQGATVWREILDLDFSTTMRFWNGPQLLIVDELGYLPLPAEAASHLFQVVSRRYEHGSIILTTSRGIASWGEIFDDTTVAAAILDRLLHHATVLSINGDSYRMRAHRDAVASLRPAITGGEFS